MTMLAQTAFDAPTGLASWLACACFLCWLTLMGLRLTDRLKSKPHPRDVQQEAAEKYVSKQECLLSHSGFRTDLQNHIEWNRREHENLFSKIGGVDRGITNRIEARLDKMEAASNLGRDKLHERINEVLAAVSNLEGRMEERRD